MDTLNQTVNGKALNDAINLMFGPELTAVVGKLYFAIDASMKAGYELGLQKGQENLEAACDASFDSGWQNAEEQCRAEAAVDINEAGSDAYDNGYLQGVSDARGNPKIADEVVQDIISVRAEEHFDALVFGEDGWVTVEDDCRICGGTCGDDTAC
jgi:hypothetical protein